MRDRDRRTTTRIWLAVTALGALILLVKGAPLFAFLLVVVAVTGLVAFLRATHPGGEHKPNLGYFFDDDDVEEEDAAAPAPPAAPDAGAAADAPVIDLRTTRREPAGANGDGGDGAPGGGASLDEAVAVSQQAADAATGNGNGNGAAKADVAAELSEHHVRLLRQVQVKLRDYE